MTRGKRGQGGTATAARVPAAACRPVLFATFRNERLIRVERVHLRSACGPGDCVGRVDEVAVAEWRAS